MTSEKLCLKLNDFQSNVSESFRELRNDLDFCDVTLTSKDNQHIKAHKVILAASSQFFMEILRTNKHSHPLIYMRGTKDKDLVAIVDFIYHGEAYVYQEDLDNFLALAEELQLKGLTGNKENITNNLKHVIPNSKLQPLAKNCQDDEQVEEHANLEDNRTDLTAIIAAESKLSNVMKNDPDVSNINEDLDTKIQKIDGIWTCNTCGKANKQKCDARRHAEIHIDGVNKTCNICGKISRSSNVLSVHIHQNQA